MTTRSKSSSFLHAWRLHRSSVRFLRAHMYADAVHSIIEGLDILQVQFTLDTPDDAISDTDRWTTGSPHALFDNNSAISIDRKPFDHCCFIAEDSVSETSDHLCCTSCESSLEVVMIYNLALSYHIYGITCDKGTNTYPFLNQGLRLYREAERRYKDHNSSSTVPSALEINMHHIYSTITYVKRRTDVSPISSLIPASETKYLQSFGNQELWLIRWWKYSYLQFLCYHNNLNFVCFLASLRLKSTNLRLLLHRYGK